MIFFLSFELTLGSERVNGNIRLWFVKNRLKISNTCNTWLIAEEMGCIATGIAGLTGDVGISWVLLEPAAVVGTGVDDIEACGKGIMYRYLSRTVTWFLSSVGDCLVESLASGRTADTGGTTDDCCVACLLTSCNDSSGL